MNPNDTAALPFFLQYLESQTDTENDTLSATDGGWCSAPWQTKIRGACILDTTKYPSDEDEVRSSL
jgi:hypothetical protein